jgi:hypothetical protein
MSNQDRDLIFGVAIVLVRHVLSVTLLFQSVVQPIAQTIAVPCRLNT